MNILIQNTYLIPTLSPITVVRGPSPPSFDEDNGWDNLDEEIMHRVLGQGVRGDGVLNISMTGMEVIVMDVATKGGYRHDISERSK